MSKYRRLFYDIETFPNVVYTWGTYKQNVIAIKEPWYILSFAYQWEGESKIYFVKAASTDKDDKNICKKLWELFNEADETVAHNGDNFDQKKVNARLIYHKFPPPAPHSQVDTLKVARSYFSFPSNKLTDLATFLGVGKKIDTGGFQLWLDCKAEIRRAWRLMTKYNKWDVFLLALVYEKLKTWNTQQPNLSLFSGSRNCPYCSSSNVVKQGTRATNRSLKQTYQCKDCLGWSSGPIGKRLPEYDGK